MALTTKNDFDPRNPCDAERLRKIPAYRSTEVEPLPKIEVKTAKF